MVFLKQYICYSKRLIYGFFIAVLLPIPAWAISERELKIEAAYVYNFFNYITFPKLTAPSEKTSATICVYNRQGLMPYLEYVRQRKQNERKLELLTVQQTPQHTCDILYVGPIANASEMIKQAHQNQILTIGLQDGFLDNGGMIQLEHQQNRIAMRINKSLIEKQGYAISSRLLSLAQEVRK